MFNGTQIRQRAKCAIMAHNGPIQSRMQKKRSSYVIESCRGSGYLEAPQVRHYGPERHEMSENTTESSTMSTSRSQGSSTSEKPLAFLLLGLDAPGQLTLGITSGIVPLGFQGSDLNNQVGSLTGQFPRVGVNDGALGLLCVRTRHNG